MQTEKRKTTRKTFVAPGVLKTESRKLDVKILNVALDGIALSAQQRIDDGLEFLLDFELPLHGTIHSLHLHAQTVFCVYAGQGEYKAGLRFIEPNSRTRLLLERFLQ